MSIPQTGGALIEHHEQLAQYMADGCKPKEDWRIGTEHEKFGYCQNQKLPLPYAGKCSVHTILKGLQDKFQWSPVFEGENLIGLEKNGANVSLEPGGQLELSGAPLESIHETCDEVNQHLSEVKEIGDQVEAEFIGLGAAPIWAQDQMHMMPKGRYKLMTKYMGKVGELGTQMMYRTCTIQVNLDFASEQDMVKKFRVALALQPVATALFANSPFLDNKVNGHKSWRAHIWQHLDPARTGMLPFVFEDGMGFERYVDYILDVPMYFVYRDGKYIDALGQSFRDFLKGELPALPGEKPLISDWADHLTTVFPEARIKRYMEMRGADGGPWRRICALPAFWVGLMYDQSALDAAWDICKDGNAEERDQLRHDAGKFGLDAEIRGMKMGELARQVVDISHAGLKARAMAGAGGMLPDETHFLNALYETLDGNQTPADELLAKYYGDWQGDISNIYAEYSY